ncbi:hypothetical protein PRIPAC_90456, partial [Pristionchus pacificus]|uniref:Uncharacterized protein n=1 Tax=Pristionchus pacificus TaxID=54126 RepID=A0A2A6CWX2_PRIPA
MRALDQDGKTDINSLVSTSNSVARRLCRLTVDKAQCLLATDTVNNILEELTNQMDSKGKELEDGSWSCASCETFLDHLFTVLNTPLPKLNEAMSTILCPAKDSDCLSAFTDVFQVSGLLGDFIKDKRTATAVCKVLKHVVAILSSSSFTSISEDDEVFAEERLLLPIVEVNVEVEVALTKR